LGDEQDILDAEPEIEPHEVIAFELCIEAWNDLSAERHLGFGVMGCIPFGALLKWAEFWDLDKEVTQTIAHVIRNLDADRLEREDADRRLKGAKR
jgi:hypothetical protein